MRHTIVRFIGFAWLVLFSVVGWAGVSDMDAEDLVRQQLRENGFRIGYDGQARRMVQLHVIAKEIGAAQSNPPEFERFRIQSFLFAERMARGAVMRSLTHVANLEAETAAFSKEDDATLRTAVASSVQSSFYPYGCQIAASAETLTDGILHTAVALSWTPDFERGIRKAFRAAPDDFPQLSDPNVPSPEWAAWAERQDFSKTVGFCSFADSEGFWRFAGIGVADVEGKTGPGLLAAMRFARQSAGANLAYALFGNVKSARQMRKQMSEAETAEVSESEIETFVMEQMRKAAKAVVRDAEVYTTTVVHPLTGRKLFVSVAGIEPRDLAEMNLLGNSRSSRTRQGGANASEGLPPRPDHSTSPASNRPDHSYRPTSNRPEHP